MPIDFTMYDKFGDKVNVLVDRALVEENQRERPRHYIGGSRLGVECARALQYEYCQTPKDPGRDFNGQTLRIFAIGHDLEELAIKWLRAAGFTLRTTQADGSQYGFETAGGRIAGHVDGIITWGADSLKQRYPMLCECKTMNAKNWRDVVKHKVRKSKPVYAAQIAVYQAYMEATVPGISQNPCMFTAINKDTAELYHELVPFDAQLAQEASDKGVRILQATEAGEWMPRAADQPDRFVCKWCDYRDTCWGENARCE